MGIMLHVHAFKDQCYRMGLQITFHAPDSVRSGFFPQKLLKPQSRDALRVSFCGDKKRFLFCIPGDQPKKTVFLHITAYRELEVLLQRAPSRLRTFSDIEKFVIGSGSHPVPHGIQIQPPRLNGTFVPVLLPKGLSGKVERRDIPKPFFCHGRIRPELDHRILYRLFFPKLRREPDRIFDFHRMNPIAVHLDASQKASCLHASFQVKHPVIHTHRLAGWIPVSEDLIIGSRCSLLKGFRRPVCIRIFPGSTCHLLRCHESQVLRQDAQSSMGDQKIPVPIAVIGALAEFPVQAANFFRIDFRLLQRPAGMQPKLL